MNVAANPTMNATNLIANGAPTSGIWIFEECADPGGLVANLPTTGSECEPLTIDSGATKQADGSAALIGAKAFTVFALPDTGLGVPNGTVCDDGANPCVIGMFVATPTAGGFSFPHLFSAPFYVSVGDGLDLGDNPGDGSPLPVTSTSASNSTVVASSATAVADGADTSRITVTLKDTNGTPVAGGKQVSLSQGAGHSAISVGGSATSTATTDLNGQAVFTVTDATHETVTYTATDVTDSNLVLQPSTPTTVTFNPPVVTASNSSVTANPTTVAAANGTDTSTVTVTLSDQGGPPQPVTGKHVTLSQALGHSAVAPASAGSDTTNAQGKATFTVTDTTSETVVYSATDSTDGIALTGQTASVTFGTLTPSAATSTVTTNTPVVSSMLNGQNQLPTGQVTVTLVAADGTSLVAGKSVTLSASSTNAQITPGSAVTGANGAATFTVSDGTAETVTFSAQDTTDGVSVSATTQVMFETSAASSTNSLITEAPNTAPADGITPISLTVTVKDQFGAPVAGATVTIAATVTATQQLSTTARVAPSGVVNEVPATTTDGTGKIGFYAYDTIAEGITFTATDTTDSVVVGNTVSATYLASAPQVNQSTVQANPSAVPADGTSASTITVTLNDHNDNPVPGIDMALTALNGSSAIAAVAATTNSAGVATFKVTDTTSEIVTYRATDTTDSLPLVGDEVAVTFGTPAPVHPVIADSVMLSNPVPFPPTDTPLRQ